MDQGSNGKARVVDLAQYRRRRASALPLFDAPQVPEPPGRAVRVGLARLDASAVEHRRRMLRFLTGR